MFNLTFSDDDFKRLVRDVVREEVATCVRALLSEQKNNDNTGDNVIKGVHGLAKYLGCGVNTAQNIVNSKILEKEKVQYQAGRGWRFNKSKLAALLDEKPEILKVNGKKQCC